MEKPAKISSQGRKPGYSLESPRAFKNNQCPEIWTELGGHIVSLSSLGVFTCSQGYKSLCYRRPESISDTYLISLR